MNNVLQYICKKVVLDYNKVILISTEDNYKNCLCVSIRIALEALNSNEEECSWWVKFLKILGGLGILKNDYLKKIT